MTGCIAARSRREGRYRRWGPRSGAGPVNPRLKIVQEEAGFGGRHARPPTMLHQTVRKAVAPSRSGHSGFSGSHRRPLRAQARAASGGDEEARVACKTVSTSRRAPCGFISDNPQNLADCDSCYYYLKPSYQKRESEANSRYFSYDYPSRCKRCHALSPGRAGACPASSDRPAPGPCCRGAGGLAVSPVCRETSVIRFWLREASARCRANSSSYGPA